MSNYIIKAAAREDNAALCALCKIPLAGNIRLALERSPDFFAGSHVQAEEVETYTCRKKDSSQIVGVFSIGKRRVFYNGVIKPLRYFSDLRVHPLAQGSRVIYEICRFITDGQFLAGEVAQTIVFADNHVMLKLIERLISHSKKMSIFKYFPAGNYHCHMIPFYSGSRLPACCNVIRAEESHITEMQQFVLANGFNKQFYPYYDFNFSGNSYYYGLSISNYYLAYSGKELVGIAGVWDQHMFKQTRVYGYSGYFRNFRKLINVYGRVTGGFQLPSPGSIINYLSIHSILISHNNPIIFSGLIDTINQDYRNKGYQYFLVGLDEKDQLNNALKIFRNKRLIEGKHFLVSNSQFLDSDLSNAPYYLEAARI